MKPFKLLLLLLPPVTTALIFLYTRNEQRIPVKNFTPGQQNTRQPKTGIEYLSRGIIWLRFPFPFGNT